MASRAVEALIRLLQQMERECSLERLRVGGPELIFRTATDRRCAEIHSPLASAGRSSRTLALHPPSDPANYSRSRNDMWRPAAAAALIDFCALARWLAAMGPIVCIALGDSIASSSRLPARPEWSSCYREYIPTLSGRRCDASGAHGLAGACQRSPLPVNALGR